MTFAITLSKLKEFMIPEQLVGETAETPETLFFFLKKDLKISQEIKRKMKIVVISKGAFKNTLYWLTLCSHTIQGWIEQRTP